MQPHRNLPFSSLLEDAVSNVTPFNTIFILHRISEHPAIRTISTRTTRTGITHRKRAHKPAQPDVLRSPHPGTANEAHGICRASGNTSARHDRRTALPTWSRRRCRLRLDPTRAGNRDHPCTTAPRQPPWPPCSWRSTPSGAQVSSPIPSEAQARTPGSFPPWSSPLNPSHHHRTSRSSPTSPPSSARRALQQAPPRSQRSHHPLNPAGTQPAQSKAQHHRWY